MIEIRLESPEDLDAIRTVNNTAFDQPDEGRIVDKIRSACKDTLSLVAANNGNVIGHIFFSPALIKSGEKVIEGMGLAPMAVLPNFQNQGIGSLLVKEGIKKLADSGCPFIIVLGHPNYYPRFGFEIASKYGLTPQWENVPDQAFMILILNKGIANEIHGVAYYRKEFSETI